MPIAVNESDLVGHGRQRAVMAVMAFLLCGCPSKPLSRATADGVDSGADEVTAGDSDKSDATTADDGNSATSDSEAEVTSDLEGEAPPALPILCTQWSVEPGDLDLGLSANVEYEAVFAMSMIMPAGAIEAVLRSADGLNHVERVDSTWSTGADLHLGDYASMGPGPSLFQVGEQPLGVLYVRSGSAGQIAVVELAPDGLGAGLFEFDISAPESEPDFTMAAGLDASGTLHVVTVHPETRVLAHWAAAWSDILAGAPIEPELASLIDGTAEDSILSEPSIAADGEGGFHVAVAQDQIAQEEGQVRYFKFSAAGLETLSSPEAGAWIFGFAPAVLAIDAVGSPALLVGHHGPVFDFSEHTLHLYRPELFSLLGSEVDSADGIGASHAMASDVAGRLHFVYPRYDAGQVTLVYGTISATGVVQRSTVPGVNVGLTDRMELHVVGSELVLPYWDRDLKAMSVARCASDL